MAQLTALRVHPRNEPAPTVLSSERGYCAASNNESYHDLPVKTGRCFTSTARKAEH